MDRALANLAWQSQARGYGAPHGAPEVTLQPLAVRGDRFVLSRSTPIDRERAAPQLLLYEVDDTGTERRVDVFDGDALDAAVAELDRRWYDSLSDDEQRSVRCALRWARAAAVWDLDAFDAILADDFEAYVARSLWAPGRRDRAQWRELQRSNADLLGRRASYDITLAEMPRPDVLISQFRTTGIVERWASGWETIEISVLQVRASQARRFGTFDGDDLDRARTWAASLPS